MSYTSQIKNSLTGNPNAFTPVDAHTQSSALSNATAISVPAGANGLLVQATGRDIRFTLDGTTPTATKGFVILAGGSPMLLMAPSDDCVFTFIETAATATLEYQAVRVYA